MGRTENCCACYNNILQHGHYIYLHRYPPHLLWWSDYSTSSALNREGGFQTMAAGGYETIGATADLQQPCWTVLTVYRRAYLE